MRAASLLYVQKTDSNLFTGTQPRYTPAAPPQARSALLEALREAHQQLLTPPPVVAEDPERLARWQPRLRSQVDWDSVEDEAAVRKADEEAAAAAKASALPAKKEKKSRRKQNRDEYIPRKPKPQPGQKVEDEPEPEPEEEKEEEIPLHELQGDDAHPFISVGLIGGLHTWVARYLLLMLDRAQDNPTSASRVCSTRCSVGRSSARLELQARRRRCR